MAAVGLANDSNLYTGIFLPNLPTARVHGTPWSAVAYQEVPSESQTLYLQQICLCMARGREKKETKKLCVCGGGGGEKRARVHINDHPCSWKRITMQIRASKHRTHRTASTIDVPYAFVKHIDRVDDVVTTSSTRKKRHTVFSGINNDEHDFAPGVLDPVAGVVVVGVGVVKSESDSEEVCKRKSEIGFTIECMCLTGAADRIVTSTPTVLVPASAPPLPPPPPPPLLLLRVVLPLSPLPSPPPVTLLPLPPLAFLAT